MPTNHQALILSDAQIKSTNFFTFSLFDLYYETSASDAGLSTLLGMMIRSIMYGHSVSMNEVSIRKTCR